MKPIGGSDVSERHAKGGGELSVVYFAPRGKISMSRGIYEFIFRIFVGLRVLVGQKMDYI